MAVRSFLGTWEVIGYGYINGSHNENTGLEGIRFRLDETGDVTWNVPEELKAVPLFSCETYEIYSTSVLGTVIRFGAYAGHVIEFKCDEFEARDSVVLTCDGWCMLHCKCIQEEPSECALNTTFSLLPALEDGYFGDIKIVASNNKQFQVHSCIVQLLGGEILWQSQPPPLTGLPEDVIGTILNFLYTECLPENLTEVTARQVIAFGAQYQTHTKLVNMCQLWLKNMALKQQIIGLVNDMHSCANQIIDHFNVRHNSPTDTIASNPAKLCFVVKQSVRDAAVVGAKLLLLCDLFTKRKNELSREERHEIIRYAKSRLPIFMTQLHKFLHAVKNTFGSMTALQRNEVATYLVPEIEVILDTVSTLIVEVEKALQQIIQVLSPHDEIRRKSGVGDMLGKSLRNVLHIRELTKLRNVHEHITCSLGLLLHKKENFYEMTPAQKVRSVARNLEQLIEELPIFLLRLEEVTGALDEKLEWREFKFCFKVGTSKVSGVLQKLVSHQHTLQDVMIQLCELVQRDAFTQSLYSLGLLDASKVTSHVEDCQKMTSNPSSSTPKQNPMGYTLNLVESLCVPPSPMNSNLSKLCLQLLKNEAGTDMEFEIVVSNSVSDQTVREHTEETSSPTDFETSTIRAHRVIVAARCDWFRRALLSGMREAIDRKIIVHDTNSTVFRVFLEYLYGGRLRQSALTSDQLAELLLLSDRYEVDSLKQVCEYGLQASIDEDSVLYFLSMADQYNAKILRSACFNFISYHNEITESELFFELPVALQAEIFDCIWTQPPGRKSNSDLLRTGTPTSPDSSNSEMQKGNLKCVLPQDHSNSSSLEDLPLSHDTARLETSLAQLRDIVGDTAPREKLIQVLLAADYDLCRAVNYFYSKTEDP